MGYGWSFVTHQQQQYTMQQMQMHTKSTIRTTRRMSAFSQSSHSTAGSFSKQNLLPPWRMTASSLRPRQNVGEDARGLPNGPTPPCVNARLDVVLLGVNMQAMALGAVFVVILWLVPGLAHAQELACVDFEVVSAVVAISVGAASVELDDVALVVALGI